MLRASSTVHAMRSIVTSLLARLDDEARASVVRPADDDLVRRSFTYLPGARPGIRLIDMDREGHKLTHRLLATTLSMDAFAQAVTIMALEEVLDRLEDGRRGRSSCDYYLVVFGDPGRDPIWTWRLEGHHLSVTMTIDGYHISPTPLFLGAHPATVRICDQSVTRPLGPEDGIARTLVLSMPTLIRDTAVVSGIAPRDIRSATARRVESPIDPLGVAAPRLPPTSRTLLARLVGLYLGRLSDEMAQQEQKSVLHDELYFAWEGSLRPGEGHYYRIQGPNLLIEYDNTANDANHSHSVLRHPHTDFGIDFDVLTAHRRTGHFTG